MAENNAKPERNPSKELVSADVQKAFHAVLKCGIYKELHKRLLISDAQLNSLIGFK